MVIQAYYGDKWHLRGPIIVFNAAIGNSANIHPVDIILTSSRCTWSGTLRLHQE
jgi:hypothetical protein